MTRRVVSQRALERFKLSPSGELLGSFDELKPEWGMYPSIDDAPYQVGDHLWVRETWTENNNPNSVNCGGYEYASDYVGTHAIGLINWKSSMFMPRWASRITLEITNIRVERVQDITEEDARAEGVIDGGCLNCGEHEPCGCGNPMPDARDAYVSIWNTLNAKRGYPWESNPWVWAISFKVVNK